MLSVVKNLNQAKPRFTNNVNVIMNNNNDSGAVRCLVKPIKLVILALSLSVKVLHNFFFALFILCAISRNFLS